MAAGARGDDRNSNADIICYKGVEPKPEMIIIKNGITQGVDTRSIFNLIAGRQGAPGNCRSQTDQEVELHSPLYGDRVHASW